MINETGSLLVQIEREIAKLLLTELRHFEITFERAAQIAKFVTSSLPENLSDAQVATIIPSLDDEFVELAGIVHKYLLKDEESRKLEVVNKVQDLVRHQDYLQANKLMSEYFSRKLKQ